MLNGGNLRPGDKVRIKATGQYTLKIKAIGYIPTAKEGVRAPALWLRFLSHRGSTVRRADDCERI